MNHKKSHKRVSAGHITKVARVVVSLLALAAMTLLFTTLEASVAQWLGWVARIQIMPLALAGAAATLAFWFGVTLLFGRLYCSWVCPLGVVQDCFAHLRHLTRRLRLRYPYHWHADKNRFRYVWLVIIVATCVVGVPVLLTFFDPYSTYGRFASELILPAVEWVAGSPVLVSSWLAFCVAALTLLIVGWVSYRRGRLLCNTVCPVGSTLSILSRYSLFHFDIDTDLCVNCRKCEHNCKAECINMADHVVDASRCVACFNCVDVCDHKAISYTYKHKKLSLPLMQPVNPSAASASTMNAGASGGSDAISDCDSAADRHDPVKVDRRQFLATGLIIASAPAIGAVAKSSNRIKALTNNSRPLPVQRAVAPPGRRSMKEFLERCTGCGLCVARCPSRVLRPSANELGWVNMLHPVMDFERSYCRYNCTRCTEICPTGALQPLTEEEKHIFIIGHAAVSTANCIGCGLCSERCPRSAIRMVVRTKEMGRGSLMVAQVDTENCIGCGACQYICPATPEKAIGVNGIA